MAFRIQLNDRIIPADHLSACVLEPTTESDAEIIKSFGREDNSIYRKLKPGDRVRVRGWGDMYNDSCKDSRGHLILGSHEDSRFFQEDRGLCGELATVRYAESSRYGLTFDNQDLRAKYCTLPGLALIPLPESNTLQVRA